eukprot:3449999-Alexandrium_andersonii.AAC.1
MPWALSERAASRPGPGPALARPGERAERTGSLHLEHPGRGAWVRASGHWWLERDGQCGPRASDRC